MDIQVDCRDNSNDVVPANAVLRIHWISRFQSFYWCEKGVWIFIYISIGMIELHGNSSWDTVQFWHENQATVTIDDVVLVTVTWYGTVHIKWLSFPQISATPSSLTTRHVLRHPLHFQDPNSSHSKSLGAWDLLWKLNCFQPLLAVSYRHWSGSNSGSNSVSTMAVVDRWFFCTAKLDLLDGTVY